MTTLIDSLVASTTRPVALRKRADLLANQQQYHDGLFWVVKEPLGLQYFRLAEEEFALLEMLDGHTSLEQLQEEFERRYAPQRIDFDGLCALIADFYSKGLVCSQAEGQGRELLRRDLQSRLQQWKQRLTNPLAIRLRGIYPGGVFECLYPRLRWMFRPSVVAGNLLLILMALALVGVKYDEFSARLPSFHQFFTVETTLWLMATLGVVKVLHEFGHGIACRHYGGECPEIGVMFLVFTPCLYCNVSDSWMIESKWRRMAVAAAGIYVELVLAAFATFLWWFSTPGLLHNLALNVMFVCSVTTLLFNANPLMRYDGYYILADFLEIPNLSQQATAVLKRLARQRLLDMQLEDDPFLPRRHLHWFALYAVASPVYRVMVTFSILWFVHEWLKPYRLQAITQAFACMSLFTLIIVPLYRGLRFLTAAKRNETLGSRNVHRLVTGCATALAAFVFCPLPHRVYGTFSLEPASPANIYVEIPGELTELYVRPGDTTRAGTALARLTNVDLELEVATLAAECERRRIQVDNLHHQRFEDSTALAQIPEAEKTLSTCEEQLAQRKRDQSRLTLIAAQSGTVLPAPDQPEKPQPSGRLNGWHGSPFEPRNQHCFLPQSTLFCQIGDPEFYEAAIVLEQSDLAFLRVGQAADLKLDELPGSTFSGVVEEIARSDLQIAPRQLSNKAGGELATKTDGGGQERPQEISYLVRVSFRAPLGQLRTGLRGQGKVYTPWQSLGSRVLHWCFQTFHFRV